MGILSYVYYAFFIAGSVTIGYLLLRLTYPEVRTMNYQEKLGSAGISGTLLTAVALFIDYIYDGSLEVLAGNGVYPIILFMLFLLSFVILKLYFQLSRPDFLTVGVPVNDTVRIEIERIEKKPEHEVHETIIGRRQGADMRDRSREKKREVIERLRKSDTKVVAEEAVELQKKENWFTKLTGIFSRKKDNTIQLDELKEAKIVPKEVPEEIAKKMEVREKQQIIAPQVISIPEKVDRTKSPEKETSQEPLEQAEDGQKTPRKGYLKMVEGIVKEPRKLAEKEPSQFVGREKEVENEEIESAGADKEKGIGKEKDRVEKEKEEAAGLPPKSPNQLDVGGHERLYVAAQKEKEDTPEGEKPRELDFHTDPKEIREKLDRVKGMQAEMFVKDVLPKTLQEEEDQKEKEGEELKHKHLYEQVQIKKAKEHTEPGHIPQPSAVEGQIIHRRYLIKGEDETTSGVSVVANSDVAQKENFNELVTDVYSQLKTSKKEGLRNSLKVSPPKDAVGTAGKPELTFEDLIGEKKEDKRAEGAGVISQLSNIAEGKKEESSKIDFVKIQAEKGMGCPTCHSKNTKIIFCPYCGTGMCANCSPYVKIKEGAFVYTCPKCREDVDIRKKSPAAKPAALGLGS